MLKTKFGTFKGGFLNDFNNTMGIDNDPYSKHNISFLMGLAYDPQKYKILIDGERVYGFSSKAKVIVRRGLNGTASAEIFLQGTSSWVEKLRLKLGDVITFEASYEGENYSANLDFRAELRLMGYEGIHTAEVPEYSFQFKDIEQEKHEKELRLQLRKRF